MDDDDRQLMVRFQARGDPAAFRLLFQRNKEPLLAFLNGLSLSPTLAEDISQRTWTKVLEIAERGAFRPSESAQFRTWLFTLARNAWLDDVRRSSRVEVVAEVPEAVEPLAEARGPEDAIDDEQVRRALQRAMRTLPTEQREAIAMWSNGLSYQAIADVTGVPVNTVIGRKRYGVEHLRAALAREGIAWSGA